MALRPVQWFYLPLRRLQGRPGGARSGRMRARGAMAPGGILPVRTAERLERLGPVVRGWYLTPDEESLERARAVVAGRFRFLNHTEAIDEVDWRRRYVSHLWSYNLHYFDYAVDLARAYRDTGEEGFRESFERLVIRWIEGARGSDGWEPYALSLRIPNWLTALTLFGEDLEPELRSRVLECVHEQARALERRLEYHIQANHLQKNFYALAFAGHFLAGKEADRWRRRGVRGLWRELFRQVLPDGGHFERSPMYHAIALGDYLRAVELCRESGESVPAAVSRRVREMARAFGLLSRGDGTLHLFNDAAHGIAEPRAVLDNLATRVVGEAVAEVRGIFELPETGYFGYCVPRSGERIVIDCGEPGPRFQPGHAHCDLLSFELDLGGRPVIVDSGVAGYEGDPLREYVRSTRAHNTVSISNLEQSEVWATFRMGRRARVVSASHDGVEDGRYRFTGAYRPYHDRRAVHERSIERVEGVWVVLDRVRGARGAPLRSFIHLHPDFRIVETGGSVLARSPEVSIAIDTFGVDDLVVRQGERDPAQGWYCPEFGRAIPAPVIELIINGNDERKFGYRVSANSRS